jgi:hypothetical protein
MNVSPYTLPRATDAEIERVLTAMIPEIRQSLKTVMQDHHPIDCFNCAEGTNSATGIKSHYMCFIAHQYAGEILEGTMQGIGKSMDTQVSAYQKLAEAKQ